MKKLICSVALCLALFGCSSGNEYIEKGNSIMEEAKKLYEEHEDSHFEYSDQTYEDNAYSCILNNDISVKMYFEDGEVYSFELSNEELNEYNIIDIINDIDESWVYILEASEIELPPNDVQDILDTIFEDDNSISKFEDNYIISYISPMFEDPNGNVDNVATFRKPILGIDKQEDYAMYDLELLSYGSYSIYISEK